MEGSQPVPTLNQQLDHFVNQMQSEVGRSGKSFHQISSEYLVLKTENLAVAQKIESLDLAEAVDLTPELFGEQCELLQRLQFLKARVFQRIDHFESGHPWQTFAHPDHRVDEFEHLLRTIRFVSIQLSKFWVEVQSFPLFLNTLDAISVHELDQIFQWLRASPAWNELIVQPRVVPALVQSTSRKALFELVRNVKSIRVLCEKAKKYQSPEALTAIHLQSSTSALVEGAELAGQLKVDLCNRVDLEARMGQFNHQLEQIRQVQKFFANLTVKTQVPQPVRPNEALLVFKAKSLVEKIPKKILPWRLPQILAPNQSVRIQGLQDRARPILEARKRIESHFSASLERDPDELRQLASVVTSGGLFRSFKTPYQEALTQYKNFLRENPGEKGKLKESPLEMADRLNEWANFIEQSQSFDKNSDIAKTFGSFFKGISTDFDTAIEANQWAAQLRADLTVSDSLFSDSLIQFITQASEEKLEEFVSHLNTEEAQGLQAILDRSEISDATTFSELGSQIHLKVAGYERLLKILDTLKVYPEVSLSSLAELRQIHEEIAFLASQLELNTEAKTALKNYYQGTDTDLGVIENGLAYLDFIDRAIVPEGLKNSLLSVYGPQRFGETRALVTQIQGSLGALKELFQRLEVVTRGQAQATLHCPIPKLLAQCHQALKQSNLLDEWIEYLKSEREARVRGLGPVLDFFEAHAVREVEFVTAYRMAIYASLLKKVIATQTRVAE